MILILEFCYCFEFELLTDIDMVHVYENIIRGGITRAIKNAEASNKYMNNFVPSKSSFIVYFYFSNQYGYF